MLSRVLHIFLLVSAALYASSSNSAKSKIIEASGPLLDKVPAGATVGILPFENTLSNEPDAGTSTAELVVNVATSKGVKVVERAQLNKVLEEQSLVASGAVSDEGAAEIGELLSAGYLVTGRISELMGERLVAIKLVNTETGEVVDSKNVSLGADAFNSMQKELLGEATQTSAVIFRSAIVPGWGQIYAGKTVRGSIWTGAFVTSVAAGIAATLQAGAKYDDYLAVDENFKNELKLIEYREDFCQSRDCEVKVIEDSIAGLSSKIQPTNGADPLDGEFLDEYKTGISNSKWDDYQSSLNTSFVVWGVTGAVWVANLIDAYIVGSERKERLDTYFTAIPTLDGGVNLQLGMNF